MLRSFSACAILIGALLVIPGLASGDTFAGSQAGCITDPNDQDDPRAEVLRFCAALSGGNAAFAIDVEQHVDPEADDGWTSGASNWRMDIEATGDSDPDFVIDYRNDDGFGVSVDVIDLTTFQTTCEGTATFGSGQYVAQGLDSSTCFGSDTYRATSSLTYQTGQGSDFVLEIDASPAVSPGAALPAPLDGNPPPPPSAPAESVRLEGPTRFDTSIAISQYQFPNGSEDVYLSRSDVFADSISSASLTRGPVLLVPQCGPVPQAVLDEIRRLNPARVVALGGTAAVCDDVLAQATAAANA